jgi:hypothetical protein
LKDYQKQEQVMIMMNGQNKHIYEYKFVFSVKRKFELLDDRVHICKGYLVDFLPRCNVSEIAVLRMDGDMYESTMDQLFYLYAIIVFKIVLKL